MRHNSTCYNRAYGALECKAHDLSVTPACTASNPEEWCQAKWCYVDPDRCDRPSEKSDFFRGVVMGAGECNKPLAYSYATCGNLNYYALGANEATKLGKLRISWPDLESATGYTNIFTKDGEAGVKDSAGKDTGRTGSTVHFMADLLEFHGIQWEFMPMSSESNNYSVSTVTNCLHEVAINRTDMCWFDSWLTDGRLSMTTMIGLFEDTFMVMVRKEAKKAATFEDMIAVPFMPFTGELWAVIMSQYIVCALIFFWLEGQSNEDDFPEPTLSKGVIECVFKGVVASFGGGLLMSPKTTPGKILVAGLSLSLMVFMSIYGAQVTTALVQSRLGAVMP